MDLWTTVIAAYAAVVATGAFFLEVRRWFESGPRLNIQVMPTMKAFNIPGTTEDKTYLIAAVANRGNAPTTITHFAMRDYGGWLGRLRSKPTWTAIVAAGPILNRIPHTLGPGEIWSGMAQHDEALRRRIDAGQLYIMVYASHLDKPLYKRVPIPAKPPENAERVQA